MPKAKTPSVYLSDHDTPEAAIEAAIADARSESAAARRFKRAYAPLVESLKLPASIEDSDDAVSAARDAARDAVTGLQADPDMEGLMDNMRYMLDQYAQHTGIDLRTAAGELPEDYSDEQTDAFFADQFKPLTDLQAQAQEAGALRRERDLTAAATALGKPADALAEILDGKTLSSRTEDRDGQQVSVWGIGEGDAFKPLSDLKAVQYLASAPTEAPKPPAAPLPLGGAGGKPADGTRTTVQERAAQKLADPNHLI